MNITSIPPEIITEIGIYLHPHHVRRLSLVNNNVFNVLNQPAYLFAKRNLGTYIEALMVERREERKIGPISQFDIRDGIKFAKLGESYMAASLLSRVHASRFYDIDLEGYVKEVVSLLALFEYMETLQHLHVNQLIPASHSEHIFICAVAASENDIVRWVLSLNHVDPSAHNNEALFAAISENNYEMFQVLLKDQRVTAVINHDITEVAAAAASWADKGKTMLLDILDEFDVSPAELRSTLKNFFYAPPNPTLLLRAAKSNSVCVVRYLIMRHWVDMDGILEALDQAVIEDNLEVVQFILNRHDFPP
ncbi:hypothetical protein HDU76_002020 [Blyttiomyces sp. JEL0837]|nr:hypothetical protein HDU76_002020 [Blyttiomyces sp. JEL0837]